MVEFTTEESFATLDSLEAIETHRAPFLEAEKEAIRPLVEGIKNSPPILEVGTGHGALASLLPERLRKKMVQTDVYQHMVKEVKAREPQALVVVASGYKLPFGNESFPVVMALSTYDVFENLGEAVKETARVLKKRGKFIHFLDFYPSLLPILHDQDKNKIPFPYTDEQGNHIGLNLIGREKARGLIGKVPESARDLFIHFIENPEREYLIIHGNPQYRRDLHLLSTFALSLARREGEIILLNDFFANKLAKSLDENGFRVTFSGNIEGSAVLHNPQLPKWLDQPGVNFIVKRIGSSSCYSDPYVAKSLREGEVLSVTTIAAIEAEKIQT